MREHTNSISKQIRYINKYYYELFTHEIRDTNLTVPQVLVFRCISEHPQTISSISESILLSNSTISGIIDRLEKKGFVKRTRDPKDRRVVWVVGTEKLNSLREKLPLLHSDYFDFLYEDLDPKSIEQINSSLELLTNHLKKKITNEKNS